MPNMDLKVDQSGSSVGGVQTRRVGYLEFFFFLDRDQFGCQMVPVWVLNGT